jgi:hypothetical protein
MSLVSMLNDRFLQSLLVSAGVWWGLDTYRPAFMFNPDGSPMVEMATPETAAAAAGILILAVHSGMIPGVYIPLIGGGGALRSLGGGQENFAASLDDILPPNNFDL